MDERTVGLPVGATVPDGVAGSVAGAGSAAGDVVTPADALVVASSIDSLALVEPVERARPRVERRGPDGWARPAGPRLLVGMPPMVA